MRSTFQAQGKTERQQGAAAREVDAFNFLFDPTSFTQVGGWGCVGGKGERASVIVGGLLCACRLWRVVTHGRTVRVIHSFQQVYIQSHQPPPPPRPAVNKQTNKQKRLIHFNM